MSFKSGDRVVFVAGWFFEEYGKYVRGSIEEIGESVMVALDERTLCQWGYEHVWCSDKDVVLEIVYDSPLYKALS